MAKIFPRFADGDEFTTSHANALFAELERWRRMRATLPLTIRNQAGDDPPLIELTQFGRFQIQLTGNGSSSGHFWQEVIWDGSDWEPSGVERESGDGDYAFEINGLFCPLGDEVYEAWRDNFGRVLFRAGTLEGVTTSGISAGSISAMTSGSVTVWSQQAGTVASSGLTVTAFNRFATSIGGSKGVSLHPWNGRWMAREWDC